MILFIIRNMFLNVLLSIKEFSVLFSSQKSYVNDKENDFDKIQQK